MYSAPSWQYGLREVINYVESVKNEYDSIKFSARINQAPTLVLFYTRYDPREYLTKGIIKYHFCDIRNCYNDSQHNLYVVLPDELQDKAPKKVFYYPNGEMAYKII